jgi:hypothetical protein
MASAIVKAITTERGGKKKNDTLAGSFGFVGARKEL